MVLGMRTGIELVGLARVELATCGLGNRRSIHLSYSPCDEILTRTIPSSSLCGSVSIVAALVLVGFLNFVLVSLGLVGLAGRLH